MKKIIFASCFAALTFCSCSDDFGNLNEDTRNPTSVPADFLFTSGQKNIADQVLSTNVNFNIYRLLVQQWTETTYTDESNYDLVTRTIPDNIFQALYRDALEDLVQSKAALALEATPTPDDVTRKANKMAQIDILMAYTYAVLVDTFGNVPYSQALDIEHYPTPAFDDAKTIYKDLIARLTADSHALDTSVSGFDSADLMYGGDTAGWQRFANSLRLRLAINMDDVDHAYASTEVLAAVADGLISDNSENAALHYLGAQPNTNPVYVDVVASGRDDFIPTNTIIDKMNALNDPRRPVYFTDIAGSYIGGVPGDGNVFPNFSHIGDRILDPANEGLLFDYAHVQFLLAEAVERGIAVTGTAEEHYNTAVTASLDYWGVGGSAAAYLAQPSVAYTTAAGTWQQKIGEQLYLALYNQGYEAYDAYRRLDYPVLTAPADALAPEVPKRFTYPAAEQTLNGTNYAQAASAIGGDTLLTHVFWDVH